MAKRKAKAADVATESAAPQAGEANGTDGAADGVAPIPMSAEAGAHADANNGTSAAKKPRAPRKRSGASPAVNDHTLAVAPATTMPTVPTASSASEPPANVIPIWRARSYDPDAPGPGATDDETPGNTDDPPDPDELELMNEWEDAMASVRARRREREERQRRAAAEAEPLTGPALREVVERDLRVGGSLSQSLPGYEERPAQITMALNVADALSAGEHLVAEASTGTGKSLAYLLPIVRSGKVALVSTANKALQEQLFYKDIPFLQQHIKPFEAALVKGMGNYLCLDRLSEERHSLVPTSQATLNDLQRQVDDDPDWDGDLDLLPQTLPGEVRAHVAADSDQCAWRDCPFYGPCYVRKMREHARQAQVIVVNHTLLLLDAAMGGFLLPERDMIVIDEAHHLEEEATRAFTATVSPSRVQSLLNLRRLRDHADAQAVADANVANIALWDALARVAGPAARGGRQHLRQPLEEGLRLGTTIDAVASSLQNRRPLVMDDREEKLYEKLVARTRSLASDVRVVFGVAKPDERVYYVEYTRAQGRRPPQPSVSAAPLAVTDLLREKLFDRINTVATSATLAINGDFSFFRSRVGLENAHDITLPLTFDYESHALLYLPRMRLEPAFGTENGPYLEELAEQMLALVTASHGRAFLLFSSQNALQGVYDRLEMTLSDGGYSLLKQGDMGRIELLRQFRERPRAVLFGLKSFWEGVDVAGEALSLVVIDKLPFDPPDDPVHEARVNRMRAAGENWFGKYVLPQAILRLKQGIGRLLRTRDDRGVMAILDKRLYTKGYGRQVVAAMPPARRTNVLADVQAFFADDGAGE